MICLVHFIFLVLSRSLSLSTLLFFLFVSFSLCLSLCVFFLFVSFAQGHKLLFLFLLHCLPTFYLANLVSSTPA